MKNTDNLEIFEANFGKKSTTKRKIQNNLCVIYTRVSSKDQEDNTSLESQKRYCEEYAERKKLLVVEYFGGTHESAKTDERQELKRMLLFVKRRKISNILVFKVDRFSRSGAGGISLAEELRQGGHAIHSVTEPGDSFSPSGSFNQNMRLLMSKYENDVRKERCEVGIREHLQKGYWMGTVPFGYDQVGFKKKQQYVINKQGRLLKKAFHWKAQGDTSAEILRKLKALGLTLYSQHLSRILRNPFYCGLLSHSALNGKIVPGNQPPLVSKETFLKANEILKRNPQGYKQNRQEDHIVNIPLKNFVRCAVCGTAWTGYLVRKKGLYYYKCNKRGCACNRSAKKMHESFQDLLNEYTLNPILAEPLKCTLQNYLEYYTKDKVEVRGQMEKQLMEIEKKIERIEERFVLEEISEELFEKYMPKYRKEKDEIASQLESSQFDLSNLETGIDHAVDIITNSLEIWELGNYSVKQKLQKMVFPEGIEYDLKNDHYRTNRVNTVFDISRSLSMSYKKSKKGIKDFSANLPPSVARRGIEPLLPG